MSNHLNTRATIWRPFTQEYTAEPSLLIDYGKGAWLYPKAHKPVLDLIASWWVNVHGHAHPAIAQAIYQQASRLEQVIFASCTHQPAIDLADQLVRLLPHGLTQVFFSDNGSTAVEVALKMAYQFWQNQGKQNKKRFLAFHGGYHGDTFGAMAAGQSSGFFDPFRALCFSVDFLDFPATWDKDPEVEAKEEASYEQLQVYLEQYAEQTAALLVEPLIQGAAGMRFCRPVFLQRVLALLQDYEVISIFDEIMTGFGRTGTLFAAEQCGASYNRSHQLSYSATSGMLDRVPDIICLSKGLTGGFLPLSVTVAKKKVYDGFLSERLDQALLHGHSYTANPLGCAAALASLALFAQENVMAKIAELTEAHQRGMHQLAELKMVQQVRVKGAVAACNLVLPDAAYGSSFSKSLAQAFLQQGLLLRLLGNVLYLMPPYVIGLEDLADAYNRIYKVLSDYRF